MTLFQYACLVAYLLVAYAIWRGLWAVASWSTPDDDTPIDWREQLLFAVASLFWPVAIIWWIVDAVCHRLLRRMYRAIARLFKGRGQ